MECSKVFPCFWTSNKFFRCFLLEIFLQDSLRFSWIPGSYFEFDSMLLFILRFFLILQNITRFFLRLISVSNFKCMNIEFIRNSTLDFNLRSFSFNPLFKIETIFKFRISRIHQDSSMSSKNHENNVAS